jgi:hypothetical protein
MIGNRSTTQPRNEIISGGNGIVLKPRPYSAQKSGHQMQKSGTAVNARRINADFKPAVMSAKRTYINSSSKLRHRATGQPPLVTTMGTESSVGRRSLLADATFVRSLEQYFVAAAIACSRDTQAHPLCV